MPTLYTLDPRAHGVNAKLLFFFVCHVFRIQVLCETGGGTGCLVYCHCVQCPKLSSACPVAATFLSLVWQAAGAMYRAY